MHWYWLVDLQQVPTGLLVEPLDWLLELLERAKWVSIMLIFIKFWFHDDDIFVFTRKKYDTEVYYFLNQDFVNLHNFFLPISTCCCWTWICWWPIWAATKYCWLYDIFFDSRGNFSKKFQNPNAEKSQAKRLKTQECCSGLQRLGFNWNWEYKLFEREK